MATKPICFLSCSFQDGDKGIAAFFKNLVEEEFEVLTAESEDKTDIYEKIFPKIRASRACFAIFSKRSKVEGKDEWTPPPDILVESGFALAHHLRIYGFVEIGIEERQQGLLRFSSTSYPRFDRDRLESRRREYKRYIKEAAKELSQEITNPYDFTHIVKEVTIYRSGYGVVRHQYTAEFIRNVNDLATDHIFSGGDSAKKGFSLPHLEEMVTSGPQARKDSKFFLATSVVKGSIADDDIKLYEKIYSTDKITFCLKIPGSFTTSSLLMYEWSWGAPNLFPVDLKDLSPGERVQDLEDVVSAFRLPPIGRTNLTFILRFERPVRFTIDPIFRVFGMGDEPLVERTGAQLELQRSSLYIVYVCRLPVIVPNGQVVAQWRPR